MTYDVQIDNIIHRGIPYAELALLPLEENTFVRRRDGGWIQAKDCVELTHILAQQPAITLAPQIPQYEVQERYVAPEYNSEDYNSGEHYEENSIADNYYTEHPYNNVRYSYVNSESYFPDEFQDDNDAEEKQYNVPSAKYLRFKKKKRNAIIGVLTLGLAGLGLIGIRKTWRSNIFAGMSFSAKAGIGFVMKCVSFLLLTTLIAVPYFIYSIFALIYYSIRLRNC